MTGTLWRVVSDFAVCGLVVHDGKVTEVAPLLKWARGQAWARVRTVLVARGWHGERIDPGVSP